MRKQAIEWDGKEMSGGREGEALEHLSKQLAWDAMLGGSPCHHGMAHPRVADGRDGLQLEVSCEYIE
jgi:hypothetical protein